MQAEPLGIDRRPVRARKLALACGCALLALQATLLTYALWPSGHWWLADFRSDFYSAGRAILHGQNPYAASNWLIQHWVSLPQFSGSVPITPSKPAPVLLTAVPFALLPEVLGGALFVGAMVAAVVVALRLLGIRDWRCYVVAFGAWPMLESLHLGNTSPLLLLGVAVLWRTREQLLAPALALSGIVLIKLFPWVMGVWLLLTRRLKTLALSVVITTLAVVAGWAVIGFAGLESYPHLLAKLDGVLSGSGSSASTLLMGFGVSTGDAGRLALAGGLALLAYSWRLARHGEETRSFAVAVLATLVAAPHVWDHYYVLLYAPIALIRPRLSLLWLTPALVWPISAQPALSALAEAIVLISVVLNGRACLRTREALPSSQRSNGPNMALDPWPSAQHSSP
jgi:Glycosyltransferase family 87